MAPVTAAALGDNCIDRYLALGRSTVGGNAVNVAVHLARRGVGAAYYGAVGRRRRRQARRSLRFGTMASTSPTFAFATATTAYTDIAFDVGGERIIAHEDFGVCARYRPGADELAAMARLRHVHLGWLDDGGAVETGAARRRRERLAGPLGHAIFGGSQCRRPRHRLCVGRPSRGRRRGADRPLAGGGRPPRGGDAAALLAASRRMERTLARMDAKPGRSGRYARCRRHLHRRLHRRPTRRSATSRPASPPAATRQRKPAAILADFRRSA